MTLTLTEVRFTRSIPVLRVTNIDQAVAFYRDRLGFTIDSRAQHYAVCHRGESQLHLSEIPGPFAPAPIPGETADVNFIVTGLDSLRAHCITQNLNPTPILRRPWNVRDFSVRDPDGYEIRFNEPL